MSWADRSSNRVEMQRDGFASKGVHLSLRLESAEPILGDSFHQQILMAKFIENACV